MAIIHASETPRLIEDIPGMLAMLALPGGAFLMGSPDSDALAWPNEKPLHPITLSPFYISRFPVTRRLYASIMDETPNAWKRDSDDLLPANYLNWYQAVAFCNALSKRQGLEPCYTIDTDFNVVWNCNAKGYRLPTEAEWEYAARAGTATPWFCGDEPVTLDRYAWFKDNSADQIHPVGQKQANPWGVHDVIGNVWEWCWDWFSDYPDRLVSDPVGPDHGVSRCLRGGAYWLEAPYLRSGFRNFYLPIRGLVDFGLRCARCP